MVGSVTGVGLGGGGKEGEGGVGVVSLIGEDKEIDGTNVLGLEVSAKSARSR